MVILFVRMVFRSDWMTTVHVMTQRVKQKGPLTIFGSVAASVQYSCLLRFTFDVATYSWKTNLNWVFGVIDAHDHVTPLVFVSRACIMRSRDQAFVRTWQSLSIR